MKEARRLMVSGKVQGVGFRYFAQMTAADHDITGWAQNLDNGSVAIHTEGTTENIETFLAALKKAICLRTYTELRKHSFLFKV
ncbi:acylphosphatase [Domibacillus antri]|uniref:acylphosphatase n=1 Tax=Domibacillus antri TaxID=1714264 RepID=UPI000A8E2AF1|nr:acylphosphatase [Domibacillus antri]